MKNKVMSLILCALMIATVFAMAVPMNVSAGEKIVAEFHESYDFNFDDEGFEHVDDDTYSDVHREYGHIYFESDRSDILDERMEKKLPNTLTQSTSSWELSVDFAITNFGIINPDPAEAGWWTHAYPVFIGEADNSDLRWDSSQLNVVWERSNPEYGPTYNHIIAFYRANNGQHYDFMVWNGAEVDTIYTVELAYDIYTKTLSCEVFETIGSNSVCYDDYVIGTNSNDGFTFGKIGVSANGIDDDFDDLPDEDPVIGWSDNIDIDYVIKYLYPGEDVNPEDGVYLGVTPIYRPSLGGDAFIHIRAGLVYPNAGNGMNDYIWEFTLTGEDGWTIRTNSPYYDSFRSGDFRRVSMPGPGTYTMTVSLKGTLDYMNNYDQAPDTGASTGQVVVIVPIIPDYIYLGCESVTFTVP